MEYPYWNRPQPQKLFLKKRQCNLDVINTGHKRMRKLIDFGTAYSVFFAGAASLVSPIALDFLKTRFKDNTMAIAFTLSVVSFGVLILSTTGEKLIQHSARMRKLMLGNDFVEGWWYDISFDQDLKKTTHGVLINILFDGREFHINGVTYSPEGHRIATFNSMTCSYENKLLFAKYESHTEYFQTGVEHGVIEMQFDSYSVSYSGFYSDYTGKVKSRVQGIRVDPTDLRQYKKFKTETDNKTFIVGKIKSRQAELIQIGPVKVVD
jgi:hypothetical protein